MWPHGESAEGDVSLSVKEKWTEFSRPPSSMITDFDLKVLVEMFPCQGCLNVWLKLTTTKPTLILAIDNS